MQPSSTPAPALPAVLDLNRVLTPNQALIFAMLAQGNSVTHIAHELGVTPSSVTCSLKRARKHTGLTSVAEIRAAVNAAKAA